MTPSFTTKRKRRYSYYITHHHGLQAGGPPAARIAAHGLENAVTGRIAKLLDDPSAIAALLPDREAADLARALAQAACITDGLQHTSSRYATVRALVRRVTLGSDAFRMEIERAALLKALAMSPADHASDEPIFLTTHAIRIRQHKDVRLIIGRADGKSAGARNEPLVRLLAEARQTYDDSLAMPHLSVAEIARATGRCRKRLTKLIRIATLAPDIVERCLAGTQPATLGTAALFRIDQPIDWNEQRRLLQMI